MDHLRWSSRPTPDQPILVAAFEGWNDAGEAASTALDHLAEAWGAERFADVDPEEFFDFTATRPQIEIVEGDLRRVSWPVTEFSIASPAGAPTVILLRGVEPQLRWRTFCDQVLEVVRVLDVRLVVTLGALLADVPHTRPTAVFGSAYDERVIEALRLEPSRYEGPTGVVGVLHSACHEASIRSASLWASVPSYVAAAPSPRAALALVRRVTGMIHTEVPVADLEMASEAYERQISELVAEDDETLAYVRHLEEEHDAERLEPVSGDELAAEVERFLRGQ